MPLTGVSPAAGIEVAIVPAAGVRTLFGLIEVVGLGPAGGALGRTGATVGVDRVTLVGVGVTSPDVVTGGVARVDGAGVLVARVTGVAVAAGCANG